MAALVFARAADLPVRTRIRMVCALDLRFYYAIKSALLCNQISSCSICRALSSCHYGTRPSRLNRQAKCTCPGRVSSRAHTRPRKPLPWRSSICLVRGIRRLCIRLQPIKTHARRRRLWLRAHPRSSARRGTGTRYGRARDGRRPAPSSGHECSRCTPTLALSH